MNNSESKIYTVGEVDILKVVAELGTPLFLIDEKRIINNISNLKSALNKSGCKYAIHFSYKTNCIPGLLRIIHNQGVGAEIISPYELWLSKKLGNNPEDIIFNGVSKNDNALRLAIEDQVKLINIDSISELEKVISLGNELNKKVNIGLRLHIPVSLEAQFGVAINKHNLIGIFSKISKEKNLKFKGFSFHIGTGINSPALYIKAIRKAFLIASLIKEQFGFNLEYIDLGGGYGIKGVRVFRGFDSLLYTFLRLNPWWVKKENGICPDTFFQKISESIDIECDKYKIEKPTLIIEPGRFISGNAQMLIMKVIDIKRIKSEIAVLDSGLFNFALPLFFEDHELVMINQRPFKRQKKYTFAGNTCATLDIFWRNKKFPELKIGDILGINDCGAYFVSFSNNFCYPRPPVVLVSNGLSKVIRQRETLEDLTAKDIY